VHWLKAPPPILVTLFGIEMLTRLEHWLKALLPIVVTEFGILTRPRLLHPKNACPPIVVTLLGIVKEVKVLLGNPKTGASSSLPTCHTGKPFTELGIATAPPAPV